MNAWVVDFERRATARKRLVDEAIFGPPRGGWRLDLIQRLRRPSSMSHTANGTTVDRPR
jgi:hypothetical protein